jgi:hypothetical protein
VAAPAGDSVDDAAEAHAEAEVAAEAGAELRRVEFAGCAGTGGRGDDDARGDVATGSALGWRNLHRHSTRT